MTVRTRFAPSPTGDLHLGSARTALYAWAFAKANNGKTVLRIEDTDLERSTKEAVQVILDGLRWLGLDFDEGPFFQTKNFKRYKEVIDELLSSGKAYKCYCSKQRLEELRTKQIEAKQKPKYDGKCRDLTCEHEGDFVIRFKNPPTGEVIIDDLIHGNIVISNAELDDLIIQRADGSPTYNLTVVVDDCDMQITHVIRGDDHINNTPKQINLMQALGKAVPKFAHIPMILSKEGKKLSKRDNAASILDFQTMGILPEALLNYLLRLGWSYKDKEIFSKQEIMQLFNLENVQKSPACFDMDKLLWLNQHYIKESSPEELASVLSPLIENSIGGVIASDSEAIQNLKNIIIAYQDRAKTLVELAEKTKCFFVDDIDYNKEAAEKFLITKIKPALQDFTNKLQELGDWLPENIKVIFKDCINEHGLKFPELAQPIRIALTGDTNSPGIDVTVALLSKEKAVARLELALNSISGSFQAHTAQ